MTTVTAFLKHNFISKAQQAQPYTAMAHARYIMRQEATQSIYSERMPKQWHAVQRFLEDHENGLRKNGRVLDKFIISIPHDISEKDATETLRRFGNWLGQGRTPFLFSLQGFDTRNHHAHFIFIDRDIETGRRVYGTTERNSTHSIKLDWQRVANEAFEQMGYEVRVKVHEGYELEAENDNAPLRPDKQLEQPEPETTLPDIEPETEDAETGDKEMAAITNAAVGVDPAGTIRFLHDQRLELGYLHYHQGKLAEAKERYAWLVEQREKKAEQVGDYYEKSLPKLQEAYNAEQRLSEHQRPDGKLKGIGISVFGIDVFKSRSRQEAEQVQAYAHERKMEANQAEYTRRAYEMELVKISKQASQAEQDAYTRQAHLERVYGNEAEMTQAEEIIKNGISEAALAVSLEEAMQAYVEGEITTEEYRTFLVEAGHSAELDALDEQVAQEAEGGQSL